MPAGLGQGGGIAHGEEKDAMGIETNQSAPGHDRCDMGPARNRRVLVIDDNLQIHADFRKILLGGIRGPSRGDARWKLLNEFEKSIFGDSTTSEAHRALLCGFEVDSAQQGEEGLGMFTAALAAGRPYAMAFVDMRMPNGWDGVQTIEELWKKDPTVQVVICTAYSDRTWEQIIGRLGRRDGLLILKKPFDDAELCQAACAMTEKWNLAADARRQLHQLSQREAEWRKLSLVASRTTNGVVISDAMGRVEWINDGFTRMTEYRLAELAGRRPADLLQGPETDPATVQYMHDCISGQKGFKAEVINYSKSGRKYWVEIEVQPVCDETGAVRNFMAIESDITARKQAEEEKFRLANHIRLLLDSTGEGIYGIDNHGLITFINRAAARLLGYEPEEILGKNAHDLLHHSKPDGSHFPVEDCPIFNCFASGDNCRVDTEVFWRRDGSSYPVAYSAFPVLENGKTVGAVITFSDISARKQAEAELRNAKESAELANRAKSEFLARMSHEIRTPLNGVVGLIDLLDHTQLDQSQRHYVHLSREAAEALIAVINDILDFSKIEAGKIEIESIEFDLPKVVRDLIELLGPVAAKRGPALACDVQSDVPMSLLGDPNRVRQVLTNLIGNAIKFTPAGSVRTRVLLERSDNDQCVVAIEVEDTGIGIPSDRLDRLFKSFSQVDTSTTRKFGGTGLGLAISKRLVELMGGEIAVRSEEGKGTTFRFTVKLAIPMGAAVKRESPAPAKPAPAASGQSVHGFHILVAEDNEMNQFVVRETLKRAGCTCEIVGDGSLAIAAAENGRYDVILMDCQMPVMDGLEATRRIRQREAANPDSRRMPIIALTAEAISGDREKCLAAGMDAYVSKPLNPVQLFAAIDSLTRGVNAIAH
jgi:PAS domain S-box-containing protein